MARIYRRLCAVVRFGGEVWEVDGKTRMDANGRGGAEGEGGGGPERGDGGYGD